MKEISPQTELLYGIHPVHESLVAQKREIKQIYIVENSKNKRLEVIATLAKKQKIDISYIPEPLLRQKTQTDLHQHTAALVSALPLSDIHALINEQSFFIICDHILDPHNMGAIMRTALAAGVTGLITTRDNSAPFSPSVSRISAGAMEHLPAVRVTNLVRTMKQLKNDGFWIFGLDEKAQQSIYDTSFQGPVALVIGGEEKGIRRLVHETCDQILCIPQKGALDSLNASVAAAVTMYEIFRQRIKG
ncbi:MAG: 23S rRNA (guanosine(2251)-2'-O)-methyltransferase RlmB [Candidatus Magnetomorum sp.]|nr:23S rRNA (guanosine(2251)-2'-O)-methyltransferase RlmB [Candidatus Magnetomorum sp.]